MSQRADEMSGEGGLARTLQEITDATMPAPRYVKYHERHLQRHLSLLGNYPPRCRPPTRSAPETALGRSLHQLWGDREAARRLMTLMLDLRCSSTFQGLSFFAHVTLHIRVCRAVAAPWPPFLRCADGGKHCETCTG